MSIHIFSVQRATSTSGAAWVEIVHGGGTIWLPAQIFSQSRSKVIQMLAGEGLLLAAGDESNSFFQRLSSAGAYNGARPIDQSGWQGDFFTMPDRWVFHPDGCKPGPVVFSARFQRPAYEGTMEHWRESIGSLIKGQYLLMFIVQAALAAPLRAAAGVGGDLMFEIIAPLRSDLALLAATAFSVTGIVSTSGSGGPVSFDQVLGSGATYQEEYADLLLVADRAELAMAPESAARRGMRLRELLSSSGEPGNGYKGLTAVLLGSRSVVDLVGSKTDIGHEVARRCMCMKVSSDAPFGVLDSLPAGIGDATDFAIRLNEAAQQQHGRIIGCFIDKLVQKLAEDPDHLRVEVKRHVDTFLNHCHVNRNDTDATQPASSFGLIYAAGVLGKAEQILPRDWRCGQAILRCYKRLIAAPGVKLPFSDILEGLARSPGTVHFGVGQAKPTDGQVASGDVFVRHTHGSSELLIRKEFAAKNIAHWSVRRTTPEVRAAMVVDGAHLAPKRRLPGESKARLYAFRLKS